MAGFTAGSVPVLSGCLLAGEPHPPEFRRHLLSSVGSEGATSGAGWRTVTFAGKTHVVRQDATHLSRV